MGGESSVYIIADNISSFEIKEDRLEVDFCWITLSKASEGVLKTLRVFFCWA